MCHANLLTPFSSESSASTVFDVCISSFFLSLVTESWNASERRQLLFHYPFYWVEKNVFAEKKTLLVSGLSCFTTSKVCQNYSIRKRDGWDKQSQSNGQCCTKWACLAGHSKGVWTTWKLQNWTCSIDTPGTLVRIVGVWEQGEESSWDSREYIYTMTRVVCVWFFSEEFCALGSASRAEDNTEYWRTQPQLCTCPVRFWTGGTEESESIKTLPWMPNIFLLLWRKYFFNMD